MPLPDNRILGEKYRLVRQLDEGGMGSVWLAEHLSLHSPVAVKLITKEIADSEEGVQRFLREARAAASLRSPHVVQILDYGVDDATPYIVMELLDGESLAERLRRMRRLSARETELVLRHVARAVARAHDAGIVHRDLKPSNIFIIRNEDEELIKLLDFGIAKAALDVLGASIASNTRTGAFLGTPFYVSPEQAEGVKSLDHRTDIWSMGVIAYECLIGRQPFAGDTFGSLVLSICSRPMPVPSQHAPVPAGFDAWFARACERDVECRFQSVREAASALRLLLEPTASDVAPATQHSEGAPLLGIEAAPERLGAALEPAPAAEALGNAPTSHVGVTTGVASSSATTRRRPVRANARVLGWSALGALAVLAVLIAVSVSNLRREQPNLAATQSAAALEPSAVPLSEPNVPRLEPSAAPRQEPSAKPSAPLMPPPTSAAPQAPRPNVAPMREPPPPVVSAAAAQEHPKAGKALPGRSAGKPGLQSKPPSVRPTATVRAVEKPTQVEPSAPASHPPAAPPGQHGVNLGI